MKNFFKLIRWKNILIIAVTMILIRWAFVFPISTYYFGVGVCLPEWGFIMLVLSMVFIAAAGNVINDYFDRRADKINKPNKVIVDKIIGKRKAMGMHIWLNLLGFISSIAASIAARSFWIMLIVLLAIFLLWRYSLSLKGRVLIGNIVVAFLVALAPLIVGFAEYISSSYYVAQCGGYADNRASLASFEISAAFAGFAFLFTLVREIVKDCQDYEGDRLAGYRTLPIAIGKRKTNYVSSAVSFLALVTVFVFWKFGLGEFPMFAKNHFVAYYAIVFLLLPSLLLMVACLFARTKKGYSRLSTLCKVIMIFGLIFILILGFVIYGYAITN